MKYYLLIKDNEIPVQAWTGPGVSKKYGLPDFKTVGTRRRQVVSPELRPPLLPRKYSWYSFLSEAESTPGPWGGRKDYVNGKFDRQSNLRPSGLELTASSDCITSCPVSKDKRYIKSPSNLAPLSCV